MGTRNLTFVQVGGKYKVAQYCQWDGYPSGQGLTILKFLHGLSRERMAELKEKCRKAKKVSAKWLEKEWTKFGAKNGMATMEVSKAFAEAHPEFSRDTGPGVLHLLLERAPGMELDLDDNFVGDSLFCEWAYVIDFDAGTFEAFEGFNKKPLADGERFKGYTSKKKGFEYHPCKKAGGWMLNALPTEAEFLQKLDPKEETEVVSPLVEVAAAVAVAQPNPALDAVIAKDNGKGGLKL